MATANPAANEAVYRTAGQALSPAGAMTLQGTAIKSLLLAGLLVMAFAYTWSRAAVETVDGRMTADVSSVMGLLVIGSLGGFVTALVTCFVPRISPFTAPVYAILEGLALGGISAFVEGQGPRYQGVAFEAVSVTLGTLIVMLAAYGTGLIRATDKFRAGVVAATGGVCLVYLAGFILSFFGIHLPIYGSNLIGIGFSLVVVVIAALNLVLDFDFIQRGVEHGAPKYMEWYGGFTLLVTLVWLYLEALRLMAKLRGRD